MARLRARQAYALALAVPLIGPSLWCRLPNSQEAWLQPLGAPSTLRPPAGHLRSSQGRRLVLRAAESEEELPAEEESALEEVAEEEEEVRDEDPVLSELRAVLKERNLTEAEGVFPRYLDRIRSYADRNKAWDLLLRACVDARNLKHAEGWFKEMGGFIPGKKTYGRLMVLSGQERDVAAMNSWYQRYVEHYTPEEAVFNIILQACGRMGKPDEGKKWLREMVAHGVTHSRTSYQAMMDAHATLGDPKGAKIWMNLMESEGMELQFRQHLTYLKAMMRSRNYEQTEKLFNEVVSYEVENDKQTEQAYDVMLQACTFGARIEEAETWFQKMVDAGITPRAFSYDKMLKVYAKAQDFGGIKRWMDKMVHAGITPQATNYRTMMHTYTLAGNMLSAKEMLLKLKEMGFQVTRREYGLLIDAAASKGLLETAADHFRAMVKDGIEPGAYEYTSLLKACARSDPKRMDAAEVIFTRMVQVGMKPLPSTLGQLIQAIGRPYTKDLRIRLGVDKDSEIDWVTDDRSGRMGGNDRPRRKFGQSFGDRPGPRAAPSGHTPRSRGDARTQGKVRQAEDA